MSDSSDLLITDQMRQLNMYAIFWKFLDDSWPVSESGNGEYCLSFDEANNLCETLNLKYKNRIHHWCIMKPDGPLEDVGT